MVSSEITNSSIDRSKIILIIHLIKQYCYGFETMTQIAQDVEPGSPMLAFYFNSLYQYIAVMFLLDKKDKKMGGSIYLTLREMKLERNLKEINDVLNQPLGKTTFGEIVRQFRNNFIVHGSFHPNDLNRIYFDVDMEDPEIKATFDYLVENLYYQIKLLALRLCEQAGIPYEEVGIHHLEPGPEL